jgi:hypothetical protein
MFACGFESYASDLTLNLGGGVNIEFMLIPAGEFDMGQVGIAEPVHHVTVTKPFYMAKYELTDQQYVQIMGPHSNYGAWPSNPVDTVTWYNATDFCAKASAVCGRTVRLPTEAEWEYACRAGTTTTYYWGNNPSLIYQYAVFAQGNTYPVGSMLPNAWGLYDMIGNASEWVQDWYGPYSAGSATDPQGQATGTDGIMRGGRREAGIESCNSAVRPAIAKTYVHNCDGFRVAVDAPITPTATVHGIPYSWLQSYGIANTNDSVETANPDGDDLNNLQEYIAGTNPTNPNSCFSLGITNMVGQIIVSVPSIQATGSNYTSKSRYYDIEQRTNLLFGAWQLVPLYGHIFGNGSIITCTSVTQDQAKFYRAKVLLQ